MKKLNEEKYKYILYPNFKIIDSYLKKTQEKSKEIKKENLPKIKVLKKEFQKHLKIIELLHYTGLVFYFLLYFSAISFIFDSILKLNFISSFITNLVGLIGTPIFVSVILLVNKIKKTREEELRLISIELIHFFKR